MKILLLESLMSPIVLSVISFGCLLAGVYFYKKSRYRNMSTIVLLVVAIFSIILYVTYFVSDYFTGEGLNEAVIFHFKYGLDGAGFQIYSDLIIWSVLFLFVSTVLIIWLLFFFKSKNVCQVNSKITSFSYILLVVSILLNPGSTDIIDYINRPKQSSSDFFKYYRFPFIEKSSDRQKNLIYIYAESLERTYFDETLFPDLIQSLRKLEDKSVSFVNIGQALWTEWTVAGITGSTLGIPLATSAHGNSMSAMDSFLGSAVGTTDLLEGQGYYLAYMGGASLKFAGKGKLFKSHGFTEVLGKDELRGKIEDPSYITPWGLYDDSLLNLVYEKFLSLSESEEKFGLFTLTLDTHHPDGHPSKECNDIKYKDGSNKMLNAVACADYLLYEFINKIINSPYGKNTVIVLSSDHFAMRNSAIDLLQKGKRKNLFLVVDPDSDKPKKVHAKGTMLDVGPTILPFLGFNCAIGLGRNLLGLSSEDKKDQKYILSNIRKWKSDLLEFWEFPKIKSRLSIHPSERKFLIDKRKFNYPAIIEFDNDLRTTLHFGHLNDRASLLKEFQKIKDEGEPYFFIDECAQLASMVKDHKMTGTCLVYGKGMDDPKMLNMLAEMSFYAKDIKRMVGLQ